MNERIKALFIQLFGKNNFPKGNAEVYMSADDLKEFAELIVRECMAQCLKVEEDDESGVSVDALLCREEIRKHFGVE